MENCTGFQWDEGNIDKNWIKHKVLNIECEQVFFNTPVFILEDTKHSGDENRWYLLGKTDFDRHLFIVYTIRDNLIRVISARDMSKKEKEIYNEQN
ncbi:MAG: BrnT family toxin [Candidatus Electryonea clarkiae]|nr:BrnT family toxin [Candidatus Electryonea clarkiae]MDP8289047.1 BrnT family toxin [Candidatus Electryonea clarkiae]